MPNLKELREKLNLTQKQIADETGCSESYYCLIENNSRKPKPNLAKKIAGVLGFDWTNFYDD